MVRWATLWLGAMLVAVGLGAPAAKATDHIDGPAVLSDPSADIVDYFAFTSPTRGPGTLVLVMDLVLNAQPDMVFSPALEYVFRLRPVVQRGSGFSTRFLPFRRVEYEIRCRAAGTTPADASMTCTPRALATGLTYPDLRARFNAVDGGLASSARIFAGLRADPFKIADGVSDTLAATQQVAAALIDGRSVEALPLDVQNNIKFTGTSFLPPFNVLSIVLELDMAAVFGTRRTLFASAVEVVRRGPGGARIDRIGRPEITNFSLAPRVGTEELRDLYNQEDTFAPNPANEAKYITRLSENLWIWDALDQRFDWPRRADLPTFAPPTSFQDEHPLARLLLDDYLIVDASKPCGIEEQSYFAVEQAALVGLGGQHRSCGGRTLGADVIDDYYTIAAGGLDGGPRISDGLDVPNRPNLTVFPYLPPPFVPGPSAQP